MFFFCHDEKYFFRTRFSLRVQRLVRKYFKALVEKYLLYAPVVSGLALGRYWGATWLLVALLWKTNFYVLPIVTSYTTKFCVFLGISSRSIYFTHRTYRFFQDQNECTKWLFFALFEFFTHCVDISQSLRAKSKINTIFKRYWI